MSSVSANSSGRPSCASTLTIRGRAARGHEGIAGVRRTLVHFIDSAEFGGVERVLLTLLATLDRERWRPVLMHYPEPGLGPLLEGARRLGVETRAVPPRRGERAAVRVPRLVRAFRRERPAILHAHLNWQLACTYDLLAAALARIPGRVATQHLFVNGGSRRYPILHRLVSLCVHRYIAVSSEVARRLLRASRCSPSKVVIIHNGVEHELFQRAANATLRNALTNGVERPVVLAVGRLASQKGFRYLLEAARLLPEPIFVLVGEGDRRAKLEDQARTLGIVDRVRFLGYRSDIPELLASCDLMVLPSLYEGLPISIMEAMAAGKPVVATDIPGTDEVVVHGETGFLVPPEEPAALARDIRKVLEDGVLARRMGEAGRVRVQGKFAGAAMARSVMDVYDDVLAVRPRSARS
jgi:glycosyltransferase involved in cell wall biosynthesis